MLRRKLQQTYVPTKKNTIAALPAPYLSLPYTPTAWAHTFEPTPPLERPAVDLDGRWLQVPTAECWEFLLPTTYATAPPSTSDNSEQYSAQ
jgi:hypothetical protein